VFSERWPKLAVGLILLMGGAFAGCVAVTNVLGNGVGGPIAAWALIAALAASTLLGFLLVRASWRPSR
jgi:hypothetical protein